MLEILNPCFSLQHLDFPTSLPTPITHWTHNLLPRYGYWVRSVTVSLSHDWLEPTPCVRGRTARRKQRASPSPRTALPAISVEVIERNLTENDDINTSPYQAPTTFERPSEYQRPSGLSPVAVTRILSQCPRLHTLKINCPESWSKYSESQRTPALQTRLSNLLFNLQGLRHLDLDCRPSNQVFSGATPIYDHVLAKILERLPLLESLSCGFIQRSRGGKGAQYFARSVFELKYLKCLRLKAVACLDGLWKSVEEHDGLRNLTELAIVDCKGFTILHAHKLIKPLACHLRQLELKFEKINHSSSISRQACRSVDFLSQANTPLDLNFKLPHLVDLKLWESEPYALAYFFQDCKALRRLSYSGLSPSTWTAFAMIFASSAWPELEILTPTPWIYRTSEVSCLAAQDWLKSCCKSRKIELEGQIASA